MTRGHLPAEARHHPLDFDALIAALDGLVGEELVLPVLAGVGGSSVAAFGTLRRERCRVGLYAEHRPPEETPCGNWPLP